MIIEVNLLLINEDSMPEISIIIPMYNTEKYIRQCLISVLSQKLPSFETIVIDDCSTDNALVDYNVPLGIVLPLHAYG